MLSLCFQTAPSLDTFSGQVTLHPPQLPGTPILPWKPVHGRGIRDRTAGAHGAARTPFYVQELGAHRRRARRQHQLPQRAAATSATLRPGRLPAEARVRTTAGRNAETHSGHSRRQHCPFLLQEVAKGEKVRRSRRAEGAGARGRGSYLGAIARVCGAPKARSRRAPRRRRGAARFLQGTKAALGSGLGGQAPGSWPAP